MGKLQVLSRSPAVTIVRQQEIQAAGNENEETEFLRNSVDAIVSSRDLGKKEKLECSRALERSVHTYDSSREVSLIRNLTEATEETEETNYHEKLSIHVDCNPQTSLQALEEAERTVVVRNNHLFLSEFDKDILGLAFPDLFPFGRGHPGTKRETAVSFEECCNYYLHLAKRQFSQHRSFTMICFDICARLRVIRSTCVRSRYRPSEFEEFGEVTETELLSALQQQREQRENALIGRNTPRNEERRERARLLLKQVRVSQAFMWGSKEERLVYRRKAFSMDPFFITGAIFVTITPSEEGTLTIAAIAGRVCEESISCLENSALPDRATRRKIAGTDPMACSEYFEEVCDTFIQNVVGFNCEKGLPYAEGGIFGHAKAFLGVVEAQQSGTLHLHAILFVAGLPRTFGEFMTKCVAEDGDEYKKRLCNLVDSIVETSLPASPITKSPPACPGCGKIGSLIAKDKIGNRAFRKQKRGRPPEKTSSCASCSSSFGACEVIRSEARRLHDSLQGIRLASQRRIPFGDSYKETDELTARFCLQPTTHMWPPENESQDSEVGRLHRLFISRVALLTQQHNFRHVDSCFKASAASAQGECRYGFPRPPVDSTHIDENFCLVLGRQEHNQYINSYNNVMLALFRTNHDIRFLLGGTTDALYYAMKYVTKATEPNLAVERAIMAAYERRCRVDRQNSVQGKHVPHFRKGRALINSMALAVSKMQEVPASLCALYISRKTAFYASHGFGKLLLGQAMAIIEQEEHEAELVMRNDGTYVRATQHLDYTCRSDELEEKALVEFVAWFRRAKIPSRGTISSSDSTSRGPKDHSKDIQLFRTGHPLKKSHCLLIRKVIVVPEIIGPRLPNKEALELENDKERFGLIAMILFCPFRNHKDLKRAKATYWEAFQEFSQSRDISPLAMRMLENMQEYYVSKQNATMECEVLANARAIYTEADAVEGAAVEEHPKDENEFADIEDLELCEEEEDISSLSLALDGVDGKFQNQTNAICSDPLTKLSVEICGKENCSAMGEKGKGRKLEGQKGERVCTRVARWW